MFLVPFAFLLYILNYFNAPVTSSKQQQHTALSPSRLGGDWATDRMYVQRARGSAARQSVKEGMDGRGGGGGGKWW